MSSRFTSYWPFVAAMAIVVAASNVLVQFPVEGMIGGILLADILTWGAFTYPIAFLVTDLANRSHGPSVARMVVFIGFALAVLSSIVLPPLLFRTGLISFETAGDRLIRIAAASGIAFLVGQLLDVTIFNYLRRQSWWKAPVASSVLGSFFDTAIFFTLAFAPFVMFFGPDDGFALEIAPLMGVGPTEVPRWISWAFGDLSVKLLIAAIALVPYRLLMDSFGNWRQPTISA
jgi:uncharacterized integral membrane protein (TIGR00697 family)